MILCCSVIRSKSLELKKLCPLDDKTTYTISNIKHVIGWVKHNTPGIIKPGLCSNSIHWGGRILHTVCFWTFMHLPSTSYGGDNTWEREKAKPSGPWPLKGPCILFKQHLSAQQLHQYWPINDHAIDFEINCDGNCACLTNRFHVAMRLFSNRSQITSKCGKNKKVAHKAIAECVTDVLTTFWRLLWSISKQMPLNWWR